MKNVISLILILFFVNSLLFAQKETLEKTNKYAEVGFGVGSSQYSFSAAYNYNWQLGSKRKFFVGTGLRFTLFGGDNVNFTSAPSSLADDDKNVDTLLAPKPNINSLNLIINLGYNISSKFQVGFSIDALGFSFGPTGSPSYIRNGKAKVTAASPTSTNILLVGNNDKGSLNSLLYLKYKLNEKFGLKLAYQFLFNELTTDTKIQTIPEQNDRFRNKGALGYLGVTYSF